jgi:hypothetical protein
MPDTVSTLMVALFTCVLGMTNIYVKTASRLPEPTDLRLRVFLNMAFVLYAAICILLALLAYVFFESKISNRFVLIVVSSLIGVLAGNTEIKFAGFSLQPLATLIQRLEVMVEATTAHRMSDFDIADRARLRDQLTETLSEVELESELLQSGDNAALEQLRQGIGDRAEVYRGRMAAEIIRRSEPNARRLLKERRGRNS